MRQGRDRNPPIMALKQGLNSNSDSVFAKTARL
nr:MAG TPA: hypothetical protein [Caudoviricetes sp.]